LVTVRVIGVQVRVKVGVNVGVKLGWSGRDVPLVMVMVGRMGVFEGAAKIVGVLRTVLAKKVGVTLGVAVAKNRAHGLDIPNPSASPVGVEVAPVSGTKRPELIISRSFENPPVKRIGTVDPRIHIKSIPAIMTYLVCFALTFANLLLYNESGLQKWLCCNYPLFTLCHKNGIKV
jgi:hypothetical protein